MHLGRDWLSMRLLRAAVACAGATFMNELAAYAMQAPPLKSRDTLVKGLQSLIITAKTIV